jgi:transcriptional regulator with XRE-family HTH domain
MGLTQAELARRCGVQPHTISRYELGLRTPLQTLLDCLMRETGLEAYALVRPSEYLHQHPEFLQQYALADGHHRRGRPHKS